MTFDEIGCCHGTDKATRPERGAFAGSTGHGYMEIYERALGRRRDQPLAILEIGVQHGYSIRTWLGCFPSAEVVGVDTNPLVDPAALAPAKIYVFDVTDEASLHKMLCRHPSFDLVVDDAGHRCQQQIASLERLWPHVRPGGYYAIEDLGCSYQQSYGGEPDGRRGTTAGEIKALFDDMHTSRRADVRSVTIAPGIALMEKR